MDLFKINYDLFSNENKSLAERMRPTSLENFFGQEEILKEDSILYKMIKNKKYYSMILYGPPGSGKTSIANIISKNTDNNFVKISAVNSGTKELTDIIKVAKENLSMYNKKTILFIDEIHRFNKLQQDYLLESVENGDIIFIGATTENPYYEVNSALISRVILVELNKLNGVGLKNIVDNALKYDVVLKNKNISYTESAINYLINISNGDSRTILNYLEIVCEYLDGNEITEEYINSIFKNSKLYFDKKNDNHYDYISAFIKSMRVGDSDATVYYLASMLASGEDINFIARRMVILASEDVGNANPNAIVVANACAEAVKKIGMPESRIILSQCAVYLANSEKSNSSYLAINQAMDYVNKTGLKKIPSYLCSSVKLNKKENEEEYKYPHNFENMFTGQRYLPEEVDEKFYSPKYIGYEKNFFKDKKEE